MSECQINLLPLVPLTQAIDDAEHWARSWNSLKHRSQEAEDAGLMIIFELDERRFAVDWNVTEFSLKPADVIPIRKERQRKSKPRPRQV